MTVDIILTGEGYWQDGNFKFHVNIPDEYNIKVGFSLCFEKSGYFHFPMIFIISCPFHCKKKIENL